MKIGIVCASDDELAPFLPMIKDIKKTKKAMLEFYQGTINHLEVVAVFSGVCKVNAAIASQLLIDLFCVDCIVNAGTAGGMDPQLEILDTVISTQVCYHDVAKDILTEYHPWMKSIFFEADPKDQGRKEINDQFACQTVDMETAAIAHVCYVNHLPFISIRCITDTAKHSGIDHFEENCAQAAIIAKDITVALINELDHY